MPCAPILTTLKDTRRLRSCSRDRGSLADAAAAYERAFALDARDEWRTAAAELRAKAKAAALPPEFATIATSPRVTRGQVAAFIATSDVTDEHMAHFFYIGTEISPRAMVGLEFYGPDALLRSLAVTPELRSRGLGGRLVEHAERHARAHGARTIYLLTTTAEGFFRSRGYLAASRDSAPPRIQSSTEFAGLCPASSAFLSKHL